MSTVCKNCGIGFKGNYCFNCAQKASTTRLKTGNVLEEFWHNFTHTDTSAFGLFGAMLINPGRVVREYIAGKRKKYFNPFTFFILATAVLIFITEKIFNYEDKLFQIRNEFGQYISKHYNIIIFCSLPFLAVILKAVFFKLKYNFAEWVSFLVFSFGFINAVQICIHSFYFIFIEYHYRLEGYVKLGSYILFTVILISFIKPVTFGRWLLCIVAGLLAYFFVELISTSIAFWLWGMPLQQIINNIF